MEIFWKKGELLIKDVIELLPGDAPGYNTVAKQINTLEEKGFLSRRPLFNTFIYFPAISRKQYRGISVGDMVAKYYRNSYSSLVLQFVKEEKMSLEDLREIISLIEEDGSDKTKDDEKQ